MFNRMLVSPIRILGLCVLLCQMFDPQQHSISIAAAAEPGDTLPRLSEWKSIPVGVDRADRVVQGFVTADAIDPASKKRCVLLVAGIEGTVEETELIEKLAGWFRNLPAESELRKTMTIALTPTVRRGPAERFAEPLGFPPPGQAYQSATQPEGEYLWRWIGVLAPDVVIELRTVQTPDQAWLVPRAWTAFPHPHGESAKGSLSAGLMAKAPANMGTIPSAMRQVSAAATLQPEAFWTEIARLLPADSSPARKELRKRHERTTRETCEILAREYGRALPNAEYIPAVACLARHRFARLINSAPLQREVAELVQPYASGKTAAFPKNNVSGSIAAGHILFAELAKFDADSRANLEKLVIAAAGHAFDSQGQPLAAYPSHNEMSDAVFMATPILVHAGRITGDAKYFQQAERHFHFLRKLCLRDDGLYRHSPLDAAAWGRGNGFPTLGLVLCLEEMPTDRPEFPHFLKAYQQHITAVLPHQDATGMWHQVIDHSESYRELTATCMIGYSLCRGVRNGWLDLEQARPAIDRAWQAVKMRISDDAGLIDVCTGTGKQPNLRAYFDRPAILGKDARGGAMAFLFSTEILAMEMNP